MLVALCGGVGAARMLSGLVRVVPPDRITAIVNVGDDMVLHGLHISPDLDTVTYTLAGMDNRETGWGVVGESWAVMDELGRLGGEDWFRLGDRDLATHLFRTGRLRGGERLSSVTAELGRRRGIAVRLLPVTDDPLRTRVTLAEASALGPAGTEVGFQDYFVRLHHDVPVSGVRFEGAAAARPSPGVLESLAQADTIVVCPSNPVVSIGPVLAVPGVREACRPAGTGRGRLTDHRRRRPQGPGRPPHGRTRDRVVRRGCGAPVPPWAGTLVVDTQDADRSPDVEAEGVRCIVTPTVMSSPERAADLARVVVDAVV